MWLKNTALFILCLILPHVAHADDKDSTNYISISVENDNLGGGTDRYYTSGVRATWFNTNIKVPPVIDVLADKIPTFDFNDKTATFYTIGHNIYTPEDIRIANQPQKDRPWAAFLYGSVGLANITDNGDSPFHVDELEFTLGVVGPEALGEQAQKFVHKYVSNSPKPRGWRNQLNFEPGFMISWQRRIPYALSHDFDYFNARVEPNFSVTLGNIRANASTGATLILGSSKKQDTPQRVRPSIPGTGVFFTEKNKLNWQVFAGIDARFVARDIFLDGNTFSSSHSVDKKYLVGDASAGISLTYDDYRLSYTLNARSKEFDGQDEESVFGSVTLTRRF
ncbi:MAG: hypothetical protein COA45_09450 [Zetaproteobacteria bacterium]|nr:MAG: hypothetical protein COA45_09450 [Zetaproteobacteria bacterium]